MFSVRRTVSASLRSVGMGLVGAFLALPAPSVSSGFVNGTLLNDRDHSVGSALSLNWAGAVELGSFNGASADWVQPAVKCVFNDDLEAASIWVGMDGARSADPHLEQIGTQAVCNLGSGPSYVAWWEVVPLNTQQNIPSLTVQPGDRFHAEVNRLGNGRYRLSIENKTQHQKFETIQASPGADGSTAEWIVERPLSDGALVDLPNFGTVNIKRQVDGEQGSLFAVKMISADSTPGNIFDMALSSVSDDRVAVTWVYAF